MCKRRKGEPGSHADDHTKPTIRAAGLAFVSAVTAGVAATETRLALAPFSDGALFCNGIFTTAKDRGFAIDPVGNE